MVGYGDRVRWSVVIATLVDAGCVVAFVALGRHTHHDGDSAAGIWHTAWPFLAGLAAGLIVVRYWRRPAAVWPAGLGAWLGAAAAGMAIRVAAGQGTAVAFIAVALAFLGLLLLGWRCMALVFSHLSNTGP
jgi:peptidoglycan/LPS O-acetylase OafA/YrhL